MENNKYNPGIAIPPGETLQEVLDEKGMTQKELSIRLNCSQKHLNKVIKGTASITPDLAIKLEDVLSIPSKFWMGLEFKYQETLIRLKAIPELEDEKKFLKLIPYSEMENLNWVSKASNHLDKIKNLRSFFGVTTLESIPLLQPVAFRKSSHYESESYAIATWITKAENDSKDLDISPFDIKLLQSSVQLIKELTNRPLKASFQQLRDICSSFGVAVVINKHISKTHINGATKWLPNGRALIALSPRGKYEDIFWFTFFHELGHVLQRKKSTTFIDIDDSDLDELESDANKFALNALINEHDYNSFVLNKHYQNIVAVRKFATTQGVHTGIVVGRLMKDNLISFGDTQFQQLRRKIN